MMTRIVLYLLMRIKGVHSLNELNVWQSITPEDHLYFYIEETLLNFGVLWYFFYMNTKGQDT